MRKFYFDISEIAHPNWSGVIGAYTDLKPKKGYVELRRDFSGSREGIGPPTLSAALVIF